jgi:hypothetical protein
MQPFVSGPELSPDGKHLAAYVTINTKQFVGIFALGNGTHKLLNSAEKLDLRWTRWAGSDRLLFSVGSMVPRLGEDVLQTRLIAYDLSTQERRFIGGKSEGADGDDVLWIDPKANRSCCPTRKHSMTIPASPKSTLPRTEPSKSSPCVKARGIGTPMTRAWSAPG